jgi:hypothetical protein
MDVVLTTMGKWWCDLSHPKSLVEPIPGEKKIIAPWGFHGIIYVEDVEAEIISPLEPLSLLKMIESFGVTLTLWCV